MNASVTALAGAVLSAASALAFGSTLFESLGVRFRHGEHELLEYLAGNACLSLLVMGLAALHLARKGVFLTLGILLILLALRYGKTSRSGPADLHELSPLAWLFAGVITPFLLLYLFTAWAPEVSPDGSGYHLGVVLRYWASHGLVRIRDMYGALPESMEMLFLFAFTIGRHPAAALTHFSFLVTLPLLVIAYSLRFGIPKAGLLAAVLIFASPVIGKDGSVAYNDVALAATAFGLFYVMELWLELRQDRILIVAGILAGFSFGIKYTGFTAILYGLCVILMRQRRVVLTTVLLFTAPCIALAGPWLFKNAIYMHNPVSPFFNRFFPNPYVSPGFENDYTRAMSHYAGTTKIRELAIRYTVTGAGVQGFLGPLFLLTPVGLGVLGSARGRRLLSSAVLFALPVAANGGTRFLIPAVPCAALALGSAVAETRFAVPALMLLHAVASWPTVARLYSDGGTWQFGQPPVGAALDPGAAPDYLRANLGAGWDMAQVVERETPPGSRIYCFSCPPLAYSLRPYTVWYESTEGNAFLDMLWTPLERQRQARKHILLSFPRLETTRLRAMLTEAGPDQVWSIAEFRVWSGGHELPRSPRWKIGAWPNPWEAPFAFDNNAASKWSAERYGSRGAYLELAFDRPIAVDSVLLECPPGVPDKVGLLAAAPGGLIPVKADIQIIAVEPPTGMRRAAIAMLKRYGFEYLVIADSDYYADDFKKYAEYWGIGRKGTAGGWALNHLE